MSHSGCYHRSQALTLALLKWGQQALILVHDSWRLLAGSLHLLLPRHQRNPTCSMLMRVTPAILPMASVDLQGRPEEATAARQVQYAVNISSQSYSSMLQCYTCQVVHLIGTVTWLWVKTLYIIKHRFPYDFAG